MLSCPNIRIKITFAKLYKETTYSSSILHLHHFLPSAGNQSIQSSSAAKDRESHEHIKTNIIKVSVFYMFVLYVIHELERGLVRARVGVVGFHEVHGEEVSDVVRL